MRDFELWGLWGGVYIWGCVLGVCWGWNGIAVLVKVLGWRIGEVWQDVVTLGAVVRAMSRFVYGCFNDLMTVKGRGDIEKLDVRRGQRGYHRGYARKEDINKIDTG